MEPDRPQMSPLAVTPAAWFIRNDRICAKVCSLAAVMSLCSLLALPVSHTNRPVCQQAPSTVGQEDCPSLSAHLVSADDEDPSKPMLPPATLEGGYPANMGTSWRDPTPSDSALMETLDSCSRPSRHRAHQRLLPAHVSEAHAAKKHDLAQWHLDKASAKVRQSFLSDERSFAQSMPLRAHELRKKHFWEAECESHTHRMQEVTAQRLPKKKKCARTSMQMYILIERTDCAAFRRSAFGSTKRGIQRGC